MIYEINIDLDLEDVARTVNHVTEVSEFIENLAPDLAYSIAASPEERRLLNVYRTLQPEARTIIDVALKGKW